MLCQQLVQDASVLFCWRGPAELKRQKHLPARDLRSAGLRVALPLEIPERIYRFCFCWAKKALRVSRMN